MGVSDLKKRCRLKSHVALVAVRVLMKASLPHLKAFRGLICRIHLARMVLQGYLQANKVRFPLAEAQAQLSLLTILKCLCASLEGDVCVIPAETGACSSIG